MAESVIKNFTKIEKKVANNLAMSNIFVNTHTPHTARPRSSDKRAQRNYIFNNHTTTATSFLGGCGGFFVPCVLRGIRRDGARAVSTSKQNFAINLMIIKY